MGTNNKYTVAQRQLVRRIRELKVQQKVHYDKYILLDIKMSVLKAKLNQISL